MSGSTSLTVGGSPYTQIGIVSIPSAFASTGAAAGFNSLLQTYLNGISSSIAGATPSLGIIDDDVAKGTVYSVTGSSGNAFEEITNTDSIGGTVAGGGTYTGITVAPNVTGLLVQVPGKSVITGNGKTSLALFGANSNVNYTDTNGGTTGAATPFSPRSKDTISAYGTNANPNSSYDIMVTGKDTVNVGASYDTVSADGNATTTIYVYNGATTVQANDASFVTVQFAQGAGGTLDFINSSSNAATVFSGNYGAGKFAPNSVTAFGGAGGGYYVGGRAGANSLVGGTGAVTLQGAGPGDYLEGNSSVDNVLFAYKGNETLVGTAASSDNTFQLGLAYTGDTGAIVSNAVVSSAGSGLNTFILGSSSSFHHHRLHCCRCKQLLHLREQRGDRCKRSECLHHHRLQPGEQLDLPE